VLSSRNCKKLLRCFKPNLNHDSPVTEDDIAIRNVTNVLDAFNNALNSIEHLTNETIGPIEEKLEDIFQRLETLEEMQFSVGRIRPTGTDGSNTDQKWCDVGTETDDQDDPIKENIEKLGNIPHPPLPAPVNSLPTHPKIKAPLPLDHQIDGRENAISVTCLDTKIQELTKKVDKYSEVSTEITKMAGQVETISEINDVKKDSREKRYFVGEAKHGNHQDCGSFGDNT